MGLPKHHRLKRRDDFSRVYQKGSRFRSAHLMLRVLRRNPVSLTTKRFPEKPCSVGVSGSLNCEDRVLSTRIGISISSKVDKRSVVRNRIRRQLQAVFRRLLPQMSSDLDLLVTVHPSAVQCDYLQFLQELEQLLIDAEVINGNPRRCVL